MKRASKDGEIPVSTLPKAIQPSLKAFDLDGSGSISPLELSRGAELYKDSKNQNNKLKKVILALFVVLSLTVAVISGLTFRRRRGRKEGDQHESLRRHDRQRLHQTGGDGGDALDRPGPVQDA